MAEVTLFDLCSKPKNICWSLHVWKTRLQLNYKGINYKTEWLEFPDVAPKMKSFGLTPNAQGMPYTVPAVLFHSDGGTAMASKAVAAEIEKRYPSPALPIDTPTLQKLEKPFGDFVGPLRPELIPKTPRVVLNPVSQEYFERTRLEHFQMPLEKYEQTQGGRQTWEKAGEGLKKISELLREKGGPFLDGQQVSFGDFMLVGVLHFTKILNRPLYDWIMENYPEIGQLYNASSPWLERDNY